MNRNADETRMSGSNNDLGDVPSKALGDVYRRVPIGLCHFDTALRFVHINDWLAALNGVSVAQHLDRTLGEVLPEIAAGIESQLRQVIETGAPILGGTVDAETPAQPGRIRNFQHSYFPVMDDDGTVVGVSCVVEEITEHKRLEDSLRLSEERFRDFTKVASDWFWEQDSSLRFTHLSTGAYDKSGVHASDFVGKTRREVIELGVSDAQWRQHDSDLAAHRPFSDFTYQRHDPTGQLRDLSISGKPVFDAEGRFKGYRGVGRDITERKRGEEALREAHKMEALGTLAGGIAHDFNNALLPIIGLTELALGKLSKDSVEARHLDKVRSAAYHAQDLVRQILAFSRHEPPERRPIDLQSVAHEACRFLRAGLPTSIQIRERLDETTALVLADPNQIGQVIVNFGTNAGDAMAEDGGILTVEISEVQIGPNHGTIQTERAAGPHVRLTVTDTGCGIDQDDIERIFDPFFTTKEIGNGTGLGLSVVHGIVKSHGGTMTVKSEPGKGSTFSVLFPVLEKSIDETSEPDLVLERIDPDPKERRNVPPRPMPEPSDRLQIPTGD